MQPAIGLLLAAMAAFTFMLAVTASASAETTDYPLGTMDRLRIRVAEWRTAEGAVRDWSSMSGEYTVGPSGNISLPFVGEMPVAGKTTAEVATKISDELQQKFGLLDRPDASVELAEYRPIFVSGDVQTPGKYPYAPGLTVLKALSLASGLRHADTGQRFARDFINARGNYDVLVAQRDGLIARRARLIAEAEGSAQIDFPKELQQSAIGKKLMADESAYKEARERRLKVQLDALSDLKSILQAEVESLEKNMATQNRQIDLSKKELASVGSLAQKGLVVNDRILTLERQTADLEGKVLNMETASLQAKQAISKASQDATNLQTDRATQIDQDRQQAEADLREAELKIQMYRDLMGEAMEQDPSAAVGAGSTYARDVTYSIVREADGKATEIQADENTAVLPGDVIKVSIAVAPASANSN
ncbi:polysaccharide biosynthesis/export family protein [Mesorhizobium sp. BAC0120]|uniref:polysaccharide biosynthesis/export family protein n=1 Tax=Mesorhizobium sp. BAC0120 TaxID=3090670 RepID=UPI00399BC87F